MAGVSVNSGNELVNIGDMRQPYKGQEAAFTTDVLPKKEPFSLFEMWFKDACKTESIKEPNAMALATADKSGKPSVRYVLLKGYSKDGFCFFTNHSSRKGKELAENPQAALLFYWEQLFRQIRIEGTVKRLSEKESEDYFHSRPHSSQISATISNQSSVIESRDVLIEKQEELLRQYPVDTNVIPKPSYWGGYKVIPETIEFWQGQTNRLHDRIRFRHLVPNEVIDSAKTFTGENGWIYERLAP